MKRLAGPLVVITLALPVPAPAQTAPSPPEMCRIGTSYTVEVVRGDVSCRKAKRVLRYYLRNHRSPDNWRCRHGRGGEQWDVQCRSRVGRRLVRAYPIMS